MAQKITVGIVQSRPVFNDLTASLEKAVGLISTAAKMGASLVAFGETYLAGYPAWLDHSPTAALWDHEPTKQVFGQMRRNSLIVPGRETKVLGIAARENNVTVVIGVNERVDRGPGNGTLYNSLLTFDETGELVNHHRKLVPTYTERMVHGNGDGDGLRTVDTLSGRIGGMICWEHWMPLARQSMHSAGEDVHVGVLPTVHEMHQITCRQYAFEGRCFVLAVGSILLAEDIPEEFPLTAGTDPASCLLRGGSCVISPDGSYVVEPVYDVETIVTAEIDLSIIDREKMTLDVSGHYHRPDVFDFNVKRDTRQSNG